MDKRYVVADLYCCAGGAGMGLSDAGFEVIGFDIAPQPNYPFEFIQMDVTKLTAKDLSEFDAIWASPPCHAYTQGLAGHRKGNPGYQKLRIDKDLIPITRQILSASGRPYIIENVMGAPLIDPIRLCGTMFDLMVLRHRLFETSFLAEEPPHKPHYRGMTTRNRPKTERPCNGPYFTVANCGYGNKEQWSRAMGIDWMTKQELTQAIPPAYSRFLGEYLMNAIMDNAELEMVA